MTEVLDRKQAIAARFGACARDYDAHAGLQRHVASHLAEFLPDLDAAEVLEVGCGTGFLTGYLLRKYRLANFLITDLAPEMVAVCRERHGAGAVYRVMDGEASDCDGPFDLIATSMTPQWFLDPVAGLTRLRSILKPGGMLLYATLGPDGFAEWRAALTVEGLADGTVAMPELPGVFESERKTISYDSGRDFLAAMREIGAGEARDGYSAVTPGRLRRAIRRLEIDHGARVTWHIVYGRLEAQG